jgi:hypothetical protein
VPTGYLLYKVSFSLEGPHPCEGTVYYDPISGPAKAEDKKSTSAIGNSVTGLGISGLQTVNRPNATTGIGSWAVCEQASKTDTSVTWKFRFQGWTAERRTATINDKKELEIDWRDVPEAIKQSATLHTVWVKP